MEVSPHFKLSTLVYVNSATKVFWWYLTHTPTLPKSLLAILAKHTHLVYSCEHAGTTPRTWAEAGDSKMDFAHASHTTSHG